MNGLNLKQQTQGVFPTNVNFDTHEDVIDFNETSRILPLDFAYIGPNLNYKVGLGKL